MQTKLFFTMLMIFTFLVSSACIAAGSEEVNEIAEAKARTKFDHVGLAVYYENEAKAMKEKAKEQEKLLAEYKNHSEYYGREGQDFESHHEALLRKYSKSAERNLEMAASHRKMAEKVKGP